MHWQVLSVIPLIQSSLKFLIPPPPPLLLLLLPFVLPLFFFLFPMRTCVGVGMRTTWSVRLVRDGSEGGRKGMAKVSCSLRRPPICQAAIRQRRLTQARAMEADITFLAVADDVRTSDWRFRELAAGCRRFRATFL